MQTISLLYKIILDALFPLSLAEEELASMKPGEAIAKLPPAPEYGGLVVDLPNTRSIFAYKDERTAKLVWNIKYKKSKHAVQIGGYALWNELMKRPENPLPSPVVIIPIPITKRRRRERGYNQCELLVDEIARLDLDKRFQIEKNLLIRTRHASRQTLKGRDDRVENAKGIFGINEKVMTKYFEDAERHIEYSNEPIVQSQQKSGVSIFPTVIVIDDVITTGSTIYEAIETLKRAGFADVRGLSLAH